MTQLISPLLIRQAVILRPLSSPIMSRVTEVGVQSEEGVPQRQGLEEEQASESKLGCLALCPRHVAQI